jgi:hypothetical protein
VKRIAGRDRWPFQSPGIRTGGHYSSPNFNALPTVKPEKCLESASEVLRAVPDSNGFALGDRLAELGTETRLQ